MGKKAKPAAEVVPSVVGAFTETSVAPEDLMKAFVAPAPQQPKQAPSVGRIVHFTHDAGRTSAAIVTDVNESTVALHVFPRTGVAANVDLDNVPFSAEPADGHWSWPPRV